jgi:ATP-binding cassette subfamily B protein
LFCAYGRPIVTIFKQFLKNTPNFLVVNGGMFMKTLGRLLGLIKPYVMLSSLALFLMVLSTVVDYITPLLLKLVIDDGIGTGNVSLVVRYVLMMAGFAVLRAILVYGQSFVMERNGQKISYDLRNKLYAHMQRLSFSFFDKMQTGQIMSRVTGDIDCVRNFLGFGFINLIMCILNFIFTIGLFIWASWKLALIVLLPTPALILVIVLFSKRINPKWEIIREQMGKLTTVLQENVTGIRVVKAFAREAHEEGKFDGRNNGNYVENLKRAKIEANSFPLMDLLGGMNFLLLTLVGGYFVISGDITVGTFTALQWYAWGLIWPVRFSGWLVNVMQQALAAAPRVFEILDAEPDVDDKPEASALQAVKGHVALKNVSYNFPDGQPALKNINLDIKPGEILAVIGGTGSGKSTLIGLLPRFFDPTEGSVQVDGFDIRDVTMDSLRSNIGIVMQETFLFSDTIRENIAYGRPEASQEEVECAAKMACIHNFIESLPDGYDTRVGERGVGLSGGQKQRIAIARALLMNPAVLILDEATASVDTATERAIQTSLNGAMKGRTTLIIAQRLSTIKNAHRIIVLENGEVVETGSHDQLIKNNGYYSRLYELQFKSQEIPDIA